jgi:hypothetical protein
MANAAELEAQGYTLYRREGAAVGQLENMSLFTLTNIPS